MKKSLILFLTKIIIPGLIVLLMLSACFMFITRHKRTEAEKHKKHELLLNVIKKQKPPAS